MKIIKNKFYYYAKEKRKMKCIKVGKELSWFVDWMGHKYQFYNHDMYINIRNRN